MSPPTTNATWAAFQRAPGVSVWHTPRPMHDSKPLQLRDFSRLPLMFSFPFLVVVGSLFAACSEAETPDEPESEESSGATGGQSSSGWGGAASGGEGSGQQGGGGEAPVMGAAGAASFDPPACPDSSVGYASEVLDYSFGSEPAFGQENFPEAVFHGPEGGGCCKGSFAVVSLGDGGSVSLGFGARRIVDGSGPDFVVFENAFLIGGEGGEPFAEVGRVAVSVDGEEWTEFECNPASPFEAHCAGVSPVLTNVVSGEGDAFDPEVSGGDLFDLADVGLAEARYVRVTDVPGDGQIFDLDAMAILNGECE